MTFLKNTRKQLALVVGINYFNTNAELNGCINDAHRIREFLVTHLGCTRSDIAVMTDDSDNKPTHAGIMAALDTMVQRIHDEDISQVWFSYSGHGSYVTDTERDESVNSGDPHGYDEALVPLDYDTNGLITDDMLYHSFIKKIPKHVNVISLVDACHSGTALDLPYVYRCDTQIIETNKSVQDIGQLANVIKISGCRDSQTSADAYIAQRYQGAMTNAFFKMLEIHNYNVSPKQLVRQMVRYLNQNRFEQKPTLSITDLDLLNVPMFGETVHTANTKIVLKGDHWSDHETTWNIKSIDTGLNIYKNNVTFDMYTEALEVDVYLDVGKYELVLVDTYGDGGVTGEVRDIEDDKQIARVSFYVGTHMAVGFEVK